MWYFNKFFKGDMLNDPVESQFFTTNEIDSLNNALVREVIQNSLDARLKDNANVKVEFILNKKDNDILDYSDVKDYFSGLSEHLEAKDNGLMRSLPEFKKGIPYILIEDFGTKGLEGDYTTDDVEDEQENQDFYWFWRNKNRTNKGKDERGRWGVGKTVFPASSQINSFFGLTIQNSTKKELLMGHSVLKIHKVSNQRFHPFGYFGQQDSQYPKFIHPYKQANEFKKKFNLNRKDEPGLSLIIPFPFDEIEEETLALAVLKQYFYPILKGELLVTIKSGNNGKEYNFKKDSLDRIIEKFPNNLLDGKNKQNLHKLKEFSEWAINQNDFYVFDDTKLTKKPTWTFNKLVNDQNQFNNLQEKFESGERLAFKIPVKILTAKNDEIVDWYKAFIQKDEELNESEEHFIRSGLTIIGNETDKNFSGYSIVDIEEEGELSHLLGDSENPAHTQWQKNSKRIHDKYKNADKVIPFIIKTISKLRSWLSKPPEGRIDDELIDVFYIDDDESKEAEKDKEGKGDKNKSATKSNGSGNHLKIDKIKNGFKMTKHQKSDKEMRDKTYRIITAYDIPRGSPFNAYDILDYDFSNSTEISIESNNIKLHNCYENKIIFSPSAEDFYLKVSGFDPNRDLVIDVKEK